MEVNHQLGMVRQDVHMLAGIGQELVPMFLGTQNLDDRVRTGLLQHLLLHSPILGGGCQQALQELIVRQGSGLKKECFGMVAKLVPFALGIEYLDQETQQILTRQGLRGQFKDIEVPKGIGILLSKRLFSQLNGCRTMSQGHHPLHRRQNPMGEFVRDGLGNLHKAIEILGNFQKMQQNPRLREGIKLLVMCIQYI